MPETVNYSAVQTKRKMITSIQSSLPGASSWKDLDFKLDFVARI